MTATRHQTEIAADRELPMIRITREFDAPREKVFRAHTDPELLAQWMGPRDRAMRVEHYDCRTGGSWRYVIVRDHDEQGFHGCFHEVRPDETIVQTFTWEGQPDGVSLERLTLEDLGNGRTRLVASSIVESFAVRDAILASGMDKGVREGYEKLDELLSR